MSPYRLIASIAILLAVAISPAAAEVVPVPFSGQLTENGQPLNGTYVLTLSLYYDPVDPGSFMASDVETVLVQDGVFHTEIHFEEAMYAGADRWIGISKNSEPELTPRLPIHYVPMATYARTSGSAYHAAIANYAEEAGSLTGGYFPIGINFNTDTAPTSQTVFATFQDSVKIGVPGPGYVVVTCTASPSTSSIFRGHVTYYLSDKKATTGSRILYTGGYSNWGSDPMVDERGVGTFTITGVFPVSGTIPGGYHAYYLYRDNNSSAENSFFSVGPIRMMAVYYPTRMDQPEQ